MLLGQAVIGANDRASRLLDSTRKLSIPLIERPDYMLGRLAGSHAG
jgi:hypothetical protein